MDVLKYFNIFARQKFCSFLRTPVKKYAILPYDKSLHLDHYSMVSQHCVVGC